MTLEPFKNCSEHFAIAADWLITMSDKPTDKRELTERCKTANKNNQAWLEDSVVIISDKKISKILPRSEFDAHYPLIQLIELKGMALMPGLINAHCHAAMSLLRGFSDDLQLEQWLETAIWPVEAQFVDDDFVFQGTELAIAEMIRSGTTCFQDMYYMPNQIAKAVQQTGIRANIGLMVVDSENIWATNAQQCISKGLEVYDRYKHSPNISFSFAPHAPYTVSQETLQSLSTLSFELSLNIHIHLHETKTEVQQYHKQFGVRPLQKLEQLGLLNPQLNAVHMTEINFQEIEWLATHGSHVIHCPQSNMKLASGICPTNKLLAAGVNIAIGTDGAASNNDLDMLSELQTAALLAKIDSGNAEAMTAHQSLYAATMGGAKALGLEELVGSIEIGKQADLIAIDLNQLETQPVYNPLSQIVFAASRNQVAHVWVAGKQLLNNRILTTINEKQVLQNASIWRRKIKEFQP